MNTLELPSIVSNFSSASNGMLSAVLDQSTDCIKVIGPTGTIEYMNRNGRCAMGIDDFDMVAGKYWWDLWPGESEPLLRNAISQAQQGRSSRFEAFCPTGQGQPRWWDVSVAPLRDDDGVLKGLISVSRDISADVVARQIRENSVAEMKHRLQNAYALTSAIVMATARGSPEHEGFAREIVERLRRLGVAQSLLLDADALGMPTLDVLVRRLTEPFCSNAASLDIGELPHVALAETQVRTLALVLGELSTNSNKYGALGHGGRIAIRGTIDHGTLDLRWSEATDLPVAAKQRDGSAGLTLIRRTLAAQGGNVEIEWHANGLDVAITMPGF